MDIAPTSLHERTPLILGSEEDVRECETFLDGRHPALTAERRNHGGREGRGPITASPSEERQAGER